MTQPGELLTAVNRLTLLLQGQNERWEALTNLIGEQNNYIAQLIVTSNDVVEITRKQTETTGQLSDRVRELVEMTQTLVTALDAALSRKEER